MFDPTMVGLEIGPSYNPLVPKGRFPNVKIADYTSADKLRAIHSANASQIEEVDFVTDGKSLLEAIPNRGDFNYIVASHMIEHTPNLIEFINQCEQLLSPDGILVLVVPDKRHCFDVFMGLTSTGDILQADLEKRTRHPAGKQFDHGAYAACRGDQHSIVWPLGYEGELHFAHPLDNALTRYTHAANTDDYVDSHSWKFTPSSFRLIMNDLYETGYIHLREDKFTDSTGPEFYISLSRTGAGPDLSRIELAKGAVRETQAIPL